jgi:hypothetical protein
MAAPNSTGSTCEGIPITFTSTVPAGAAGIVWSGDVSGSGTVTTKTTASGTGTYYAYVKAYTKSGTLTCYGTISSAAWGYVRPTGNNGDINTYGCCNTAYWFASVCTTQSWTQSDGCGNEAYSFSTIGDENDALGWHESRALTEIISHYSRTYLTNKIYDLNLQSGPYRNTGTDCAMSPSNKSPCSVAKWKAWACTK